jgi:hypothetical protein
VRRNDVVVYCGVKQHVHIMRHVGGGAVMLSGPMIEKRFVIRDVAEQANF